MLNFEMTKPDHIISLATSALLVSVDVNVWSGTKQDRAISDEITSSKKADSSAGRFVKNLLADDKFHKRVLNYRQTIYNWLKRSTYRWNNTQDLLPVVDLIKFREEYAQHETQFYKMLDDFLANYRSIVSNMAFKQGDMFNIEDYPSEEQVRRKFGCRLYVAEVPEQDFRCQVAQDLAEDLKQRYQRQAEEIVNNVVDEQIERISEVIESISHCCGVDVITDSQSGEQQVKRRKIYETTIEKAKNLCKTIKGFKLKNDEKSNKLLDVVTKLDQALHGVDSELIRENDVVRNKVKNEVDEILGKFIF